MTHDADDWDAAERDALRGLAREVPVPAEAEERTVAAMRRSGLLNRRRGRGWLAAAAGIAAAFAGGLALGRPPAPAPPDDRPQFMVLLYGAEPRDAAEEQRQVGEIKAWARGLAERGNALSGAKLAESEYRLGEGEVETTRGLGGYIVLAAKGAEEALAMARTCPHLRHGGRIVLRPVDPT